MLQKIIISSNDPNIAYLFQRYAQEIGYAEAHVCTSAQVAALVLDLEPALVILDVDLGEPADWDVVRQIKAAPATAHIPLVIYSCLDGPPENWREDVDGLVLRSVMYGDFVAVVEQARAPRLSVNRSPSAELTELRDTDPTPAPAEHCPPEPVNRVNGLDSRRN